MTDAARPRYVILRHEPAPGDARTLHWDLMLEADGRLRTWALEAEPAAGQSTGAQQLADHRRDYLNYEGPISGNRGQVSRWDAGYYWLEQEEPDVITIRLEGSRLMGRAMLARDPAEVQRWTFSLVADPTST